MTTALLKLKKHYNARWLVRLPHDTDLGDRETDLGERDRERLGDLERERPHLLGVRDLQ